MSKASRPKEAEKQESRISMVFAICSAVWNVNRQCGDRTSHVEWCSQHLEIEPFMSHSICSISDMILAGLSNFNFAVGMVYPVLWNFDLPILQCTIICNIVKFQPSNLI